MADRKLKVLFITHDASRTGAPMVVYNIVSWISKHIPEWNIDVLSLQDGPFSERFISLPITYSLLDRKSPLWLRLARRVIPSLEEWLHQNRINRIARRQYDIVYPNSVLSLKTAIEIKRNSAARLICHLHELPTVIRVLKVDTSLFGSVDRFIAPSRAVKDAFVETFGIPETQIEVIYETLNLTTNANEPNIDTTGMDSRFVGQRIILGAGSAHWRKGYDYFIEVARVLLSKYHPDNVVFLWMGRITENLRTIVEEDIRKLGLKNRIYFIGEKENPMPYFKETDVFLMTSREDPFPLVCLLAGSVGVPVICFEKAGGVPELVQDGAGITVPYGDTTAMADAVSELLQNEPYRVQLGETLAKRIPDYDVDHIVPKIVEQIRHVAG